MPFYKYFYHLNLKEPHSLSLLYTVSTNLGSSVFKKSLSILKTGNEKRNRFRDSFPLCVDYKKIFLHFQLNI
nr:MAG TPA: hypothetical protein [Bacteriophage sp.]